MWKKLLRNSILTGIFSLALLIPGLAGASLSSFWTETNQKFIPCGPERKALAAEYAIWGYNCTADQNNLLEKRLRESYVSPDLLGYSVVSGYRSSLTLPMTAVQTTVPVSSVVTKDGHTLTTADFGNATVFLTIEPGGSKEEIVKCTAISGNSFTGCTRGLAFYGTSTVAVAANQKTHAASSQVVMSNVHYVYEQFVDKDDTETIGGAKTATGAWIFNSAVKFDVLPTSTLTAPTDPSQLITLDYLTSVTSTGCANASDSVRGCVEEASNADLISGTAVGATGARLYIPVSQTVTTSAGAADTNKVSRLDSRGKLYSTLGGVSSSLATLDSNTLVIENPANATSVPAASKLPISDASSTIDTWVNAVTKSYVAGENLTANNAVYLNSNDNQVYKTTSTDDGIFKYIGFVNSSFTAGQTAYVYTSGFLSSFSGLTPGADYFATSSGSIVSSTASVGTRVVRVGTAVSSSTLEIKNDGRRLVAQGTQATASQTTGFAANRVSVTAVGGGTNSSISSGFQTRNSSTGMSSVIGNGLACSTEQINYSNQAYLGFVYSLGSHGSCIVDWGVGGSMNISTWSTSSVSFTYSGTINWTAIFEE